MDESSIRDYAIAQVKRRMQGQAAGHGLDHVQRVVKLAQLISKSEAPCDALVVELAAWLHDVGDAKFNQGIERTAELSMEILENTSLEPKRRQHILHIVDNISFRKRETAQALSHEGKIVQDADRIEALGSIGIVRTIEYGATKEQPFFSLPTLDCKKTGVDHFFDKLFKIRSMMNTPTGKRIASSREKIMHDFLAQLAEELDDERLRERLAMRDQ